MWFFFYFVREIIHIWVIFVCFYYKVRKKWKIAKEECLQWVIFRLDFTCHEMSNAVKKVNENNNKNWHVVRSNSLNYVQKIAPRHKILSEWTVRSIKLMNNKFSKKKARTSRQGRTWRRINSLFLAVRMKSTRKYQFQPLLFTLI